MTNTLNDEMKNNMAMLAAIADDPLADTPPSKSLTNFAPPHANGAAAPHGDQLAGTPEPKILKPAPVHDTASADAAAPTQPVMRRAAAPLPISELQRQVVDSQLAVAAAIDQQREHRSRVLAARAKFQALTAVVTSQEQLRRQYIESSNADRKARVEAGGPAAPTRRLGSAIDSFAFHTKGAGPRSGGGRSFSRGAFTPGQAAKMNAVRAAQVPPKTGE